MNLSCLSEIHVNEQVTLKVLLLCSIHICILFVIFLKCFKMHFAYIKRGFLCSIEYLFCQKCKLQCYYFYLYCTILRSLLFYLIVNDYWIGNKLHYHGFVKLHSFCLLMRDITTIRRLLFVILEHVKKAYGHILAYGTIYSGFVK